MTKGQTRLRESGPSAFRQGMQTHSEKTTVTQPHPSFTRLKRVLDCQQKSRNFTITMTAR